jgi:acetyltransferase-like isoleucine patch superfamily enzyme
MYGKPKGLVVRAVRGWQLRRWRHRGLQMGTGCRLNGMPHFGSEPYLITLGNHVEISGRVTFITHDGATWVFRTRPGFERTIKYGPIVVKDNCFIGFGSIILPGVTIGPNSVVAAGSVVSKDVPPGKIVGGSPAHEIADLESYAERSRAATPTYDADAYRRDKRAELLRLFPPPR